MATRMTSACTRAGQRLHRRARTGQCALAVVEPLLRLLQPAAHEAMQLLHRSSIPCNNEARSGAASSAAAVGVGARRSAAKSAIVTSTHDDTDDHGQRAGADGSGHHLLVEGPEILDRAAARTSNTTSTSARRDTVCSICAMRAPAPSPCTGTG